MKTGLKTLGAIIIAAIVSAAFLAGCASSGSGAASTAVPASGQGTGTYRPILTETGELDIRAAVLERLLRYAAIDTQSDPNSTTSPSTMKQFDLARMLYDECIAIGLSDVKLDEYCIVYATLPANVDYDVPVVGFIGHIDTHPDASGANVVPRIFENYDGSDIVLNNGTVISTHRFPLLANYVGQTVITASGDTLLGADDKAGIAEIMTAMEYLIMNPDIPHGKISIAFTPDEEIARGTEHFDVPGFGADFAFTIDSGPLGRFAAENFNAAIAHFEITGVAVHPGYAIGVMINSLLVANEIIASFPQDEVPSKTDGFEGYIHVTDIQGDVAKTKFSAIIRYFTDEEIDARKKFLTDLAASFNEKYGEGTVKLEIADQYRNMIEMIDPKIIEYARIAYEAAGVEMDYSTIRGGTDGSFLSFMGLPCPNVFAGEHYFHGIYEFTVLETMEKAVEVIVNLSRAETYR